MAEQDEFSGLGSVMINDMYESWFLDYASYVILERAVPAIEDGLKPVQRRILHAMKEMDDGRFNKVANVIGQTMQYHPHGDASITDAMVGLGQKDLLIETQGNWGDIRTGDPAAAARYIEARLSKFALEVAFNAKTTNWQLSYDGRKNEPTTLPMKFPLLLAQGTDGIAVGLSTKILPHNFCEILDCAIKHLKGKKFELYPDFLHGGMVDVSNYNDGARGGKIRVRAKIEEADKKTLLIKSVPYGITTSTLVDSILKANESGKIKIKSVTDNTAKDVELSIILPPGVDTNQTIDALYAFTDCEISISPNACVIIGDKPHFITVSDMLRHSVQHTKALLLRELEIKLGELEDDWHYSSLEKIFIENRIYRDIEEETTWEGVLAAIDKGLTPFKKLLRRQITQDDIIKLTEIRIKRISKFDAFKADEHIRGVENNIGEVKNNIENLNDYSIRYYENLLKKYGKGRERQTEIRPFETINANTVAIANAKLYVNWKEGFIGTSLKKDEFLFDCSDLDMIITFRKNGRMMVTKVAEKTFVGKDISHVAIFQKNDERTTYNMMYVDGKTGITYGKRFNVTGITRDKEYDLTKGNPDSKVLHFSANPNGEAEVITVTLNPGCKARVKVFDYYFEELEIKARSAQGNQVTKYPVKSTRFKEKGRSTLSAMKIWYDDTVGRLNKEEKGTLLGRFDEKDRVIAFYKDGTYEITDYELTNRYDTDSLVLIEKFHPKRVVTAVYWEAKSNQFNAKRFIIESQTLKTRYLFIKEGEGNYLEFVTTMPEPIVIIRTGKKKNELTEEQVALHETIDVTGWRTIGTFIADVNMKEISLVPAVSEDTGEPEAPTLF
ncbi:DNA gyrase/topoisomerase IV subunit A [Flavipsychrobacter stenotrophus]|uniref:DNA gyrase/topoisomerase IV subunit A n=1 Tax=Flavipsychrobacter stenotrophus TaxID=2077091 RepID=A0A2S7T1Q9_9BACT|nr:DNA gyrase/topoisomerase IV subunit A [Flavipsychrobacter stenotrophus]PQJ12777.1 DNA gyrase/topoisomerase IV subunit A [Flavipsychrobacter stenotrophus]